MNQTVQVKTENKIVPYLKFGLLAGLVIFLYFPELRFVIHEWFDDYQYSHGFLIPLVSGYLIWRQREDLRTSPVLPDMKGLFVLSTGILLLVIGYAAYEPFVRRYSLIITIMGLIYFLLGKQISRILLFPVGYLIFMIPMPYIFFRSMAIHLRPINTKAACAVSKFLGIPVVQDGATLYLPNATLQIIDWCTGIQSIIAVSALSVLYANLTQRSIISKIILVVLAIPLAIMGNIFRLILNVSLAYLYGERVLSGVIHNFQGMINFLCTLFLLFIVGNIINKIEMKLISKKT